MPVQSPYAEANAKNDPATVTVGLTPLRSLALARDSARCASVRSVLYLKASLKRAPVLVFGASSAAVARAASAMRRSFTVFVLAVGSAGCWSFVSSSVSSSAVDVWSVSSGSSVEIALNVGLLSCASLLFVSWAFSIIVGGVRVMNLLFRIVDGADKEDGDRVKPLAAL